MSLDQLKTQKEDSMEELSPDDLKGLTHKFDLCLVTFLEITGKKLPTLSNINLCLNIKYLNVSNNQIGDLQPLHNLLSLQYIDASNNLISDLSPLSRLNELFKLNLEDNKIINLTQIVPLKKLRSLRYLTLKSTKPILKSDLASSLNYRKSVLELLNQLLGLDHLPPNAEEFSFAKNEEFITLEKEVQDFGQLVARDFQTISNQQLSFLTAIKDQETYFQGFDKKLDRFDDEIKDFAVKMKEMEKLMAEFL